MWFNLQHFVSTSRLLTQFCFVLYLQLVQYCSSLETSLGFTACSIPILSTQNSGYIMPSDIVSVLDTNV